MLYEIKFSAITVHLLNDRALRRCQCRGKGWKWRNLSSYLVETTHAPLPLQALPASAVHKKQSRSRCRRGSSWRCQLHCSAGDGRHKYTLTVQLILSPWKKRDFGYHRNLVFSFYMYNELRVRCTDNLSFIELYRCLARPGSLCYTYEPLTCRNTFSNLVSMILNGLQ